MNLYGKVLIFIIFFKAVSQQTVDICSEKVKSRIGDEGRIAEAIFFTYTPPKVRNLSRRVYMLSRQGNYNYIFSEI